MTPPLPLAPSAAPAAGPPEGAVLGRLGRLVARLAQGPRDVARAQALRHAVFVEEGGASRVGREAGLESDALDGVCDHLLVEEAGTATVIGTYRLLTDTVARREGRFYSDAEFEVSELVARNPERRFLELGRSCVAPGWRGRRTIELLWQGVWAYALAHGSDAMIGCVSLPGTDPAPHAGTLGLLGGAALAPPAWQARARRGSERVPLPDGPEHAPDRAALGGLPPLLKGYLRLGGRVGPDAVIDRDFNCIDVFVALPREAIARRYLRHYGVDADRLV